MRYGRRLGFVVAALAIAAPANAATPIGGTFAPANPCNGVTFLQAESPGSAYTVPSPGVITSWSHQAGTMALQMKLKIARAAGGSNFTIDAESALESLAPSQVNTFPTRIPVSGGEILGFYFSPNGPECQNGPLTGYAQASTAGDQAPGTTTAYVVSGPPGGRLDVSAVLEPDADGDGYGDETQDACPADAALQEAPCDRVAPDTTITKAPKSKTKKKQATFEFSGTDARTVAGFECSLDGGALAACASPHTVRVKKGRHTFSVRAVDAAGNADGTPATDDWKVKKKKKK